MYTALELAPAGIGGIPGSMPGIPGISGIAVGCGAVTPCDGAHRVPRAKAPTSAPATAATTRAVRGARLVGCCGEAGLGTVNIATTSLLRTGRAVVGMAHGGRMSVKSRLLPCGDAHDVRVPRRQDAQRRTS
jgi:hypothetical protein